MVTTVLLWTQPLLIGLFLGGEFDKLAAHAAVGGILVLVVLHPVPASVPAWRPGGLPGWVVAVCAAMVAGAASCRSLPATSATSACTSRSGVTLAATG